MMQPLTLAYLTFPAWLRPEIIKGLPLRWYGLMYLVAFAIAYFLFRFQVREKKLKISDEISKKLRFPSTSKVCLISYGKGLSLSRAVS